MKGFKLTLAAKEDLKEIARYTQNKWGKEKRDLYLTSLNNKFIWLAENPQVGRTRTEIKQGYMSYPEGKHIIFYRPKRTEIEILAILHQNMDFMQHL